MNDNESTYKKEIATLPQFLLLPRKKVLCSFEKDAKATSASFRINEKIVEIDGDSQKLIGVCKGVTNSSAIVWISETIVDTG